MRGTEAETLLTSAEAADRLAISRSRIYELMAGGAVRFVKIGKLRRIPSSAVTEFIERLDAEQNGPAS